MAATTDLATIRNEPANGSATPGSENGDEKINPGNIPPDLTTIFLRSALTEERLELIFRWYFFLTSDLTRINFEDLEGPWDIPELRERGVADQSLYIDCEGGPMFSIPYYNLLTGGQTREPLNGLINDPIKAGTRLRELWTAPFGKLQTSEPTDPTFKWISRPTPPVIFGASYSQDGNRTVFYRPPPGSRNLPNPPLTQRPSHGTIWAGTIYDDYSRDFMHPTQLKWQVLPLSLLLPLSNACQSIGLYHPAEIIGDADHLSVKNPLAFGFRLLETFSDPGSDYNKRRAMCVRLSHGPALQHRHPFEAILQFHIRHLERANTFGWYKRPPGINLERMQVRIPRVTGEGFIWLSERVTSLSVSVLNTDEAPYKIVILGENPVPGGNLGRKKVLDAETDNRNELAFYLDSVLPAHSDLDERGMRSCDRCFGIVQFQLSFLKSLVNWERMWIQTLRDIDKAAEFRLQSTLNDAELDEYMFDDSFQRSRCYFTILQVLRVSSDMVEEVMTDWTELQDKWNPVIKQVNMFSTEDLQALDHNWNIVAGIISSKTNRILARINQKTEEIKSLRDGLFNATSLREATKGIALNRAIYVFTVVTVIYTPIGFLAAFWALPFLESSNNAHAANPTSQTAQPGQQSQNSSIATTLPTGFIATFIIVPLLTYGLCVIIAYFLGYSAKERQALRVRGVRFVKNLKHQPGKLGRKAARYFLYLNSWRRGKTESTESSITDNDSYAS